MTAIAQDDIWQEQVDDPEVRIDGRIRPDIEDAYWQSVYWAQPYYRAGLSYDDYAAAYCAGYIGYAQYGGRYEDAEKSLCANWIRIKGDSRLSVEDALLAIRAAWDHAAMAPAELEEDLEELVPSEFIAARSGAAQQPAYAAA
ncbi:hypothetical protein H8N03_23370 [Ramlibacter sp. USB13]|uniref:Uncharacterized protein n=1 Tax=Ramlibacter cellulosilyticus TaxID=2764187 RepID=A0A923MXE4_9BURK|nr:hypothetical protein [Ramlibacter cellulosilyticus]MBC5785899.1 hypothetical protein [Ramlibacter cellulosilyticus]